MDKVAQSKLLKSFMGFTSKSTRLWVPEEFRVQDEKGNFAVPREKWPLFKIRSLSGGELEDIKDLSVTVYTANGETLVQDNSGLKKKDVVEAGLVGIKGWTIDGNPVEWSEESKKEIIDSIPPLLHTSLYLAIMNNSRLTKEEIEGLEY